MIHLQLGRIRAVTDRNWNRALVLGCWLLLWIIVWARLDVDWRDVSTGDRLNAFIGLSIGAIGIGLGVLGYRITQRQGEIAEEQHRLMREQLARRCDLRMELKHTKLADQRIRFDVAARNVGRKSTNKFYWHFWIPDAPAYGAFVVGRVEQTPVETSTIEARPHRHYAGLQRQPVFQDRPVRFGQFELDAEAAVGVTRLFWRLETSDGGFPSEKQYGVLEFTIGEAAPLRPVDSPTSQQEL